MRHKTKFSARQIAFAGVLGAITVVLGSTPTGFINIPPISVTIMHIPTIIAGVLQGPLIGGIVGAMFGAFSMYQAQISANPLDKVIFSNPLIAVVPRILVGVIAYYVFRLVRGKAGQTVLVASSGLLVGFTGYTLLGKSTSAVRWIVGTILTVAVAAMVYFVQKRYGHGPALAAAAGSLTNTVLVLGLIVAFGYLPPGVALTIGVVNGFPEAAVAMVLTGLVYRAIGRFIE